MSIPHAPEMRRTLVASTVHIPLRAAVHAEDPMVSSWPLDPIESGYLAWVSQEDGGMGFPGTPEGMEQIADYARSLGCSYIRFDSDADHIPGIPTFDWGVEADEHNHLGSHGAYRAPYPMRDHDYWGDHPDHPVEDWQYEVGNGDTREGYWQWVRNQIGSAEKDDG